MRKRVPTLFEVRLMYRDRLQFAEVEEMKRVMVLQVTWALFINIV